jgi:GLPGLI family protein
MKNFLLVVALIFGSQITDGQNSDFVNGGKIMFERKINTFAVMSIFLRETKSTSEDQINSFILQYRNTAPQFKTDSFELSFNTKYSLYKATNPDLGFSKTFAIPIAYKNLVFSNFETKTAYTEKQVFEKPFLISDSLKTLKWKITDETREIAGYTCRRANGLLFDSIYVVAFYSTEIPLKSGPESLNGLPGMILGIAIPYQHVTIFAKSVKPNDTSLEIPKIALKNKQEFVNNREFNIATEKILKNAGRFFPWIQFFLNL